MKNLQIVIGLAVIVVLGLLAATSLYAQGTPEDRSRAEVALLLAQPTAVAADIANQAEAQRQAYVAPAQGEAQAKVIIANTEQSIQEQKDQQAVQHQIDMMALEISRTLAVNNQMLLFESGKQKLIADTGVAVAQAQADAAQAVIGTITGAIGQLALPLGALIISVGGMGAIVLLLWTRATVVKDRNGDLVIIQRGRIMQPANSLSPITEAREMNWLLRWLVYRATMNAMRDNPAFKEEPWTVIKQAQALLNPQYASPLPASEQTMLALKQAQSAEHVAVAFTKTAGKAGQSQSQLAQQFIAAALPTRAAQITLPTPIIVDSQHLLAFDDQLATARPGDLA